MRPMLATTADTVPAGAEWVHEVKWDGMRVLADVREHRLGLASRTGRDVTVTFPELAGLATAYDDLLLDGEVVALVDGRPSFGALAERMNVTDARKASRLAAAAPVTYIVFDLLRLFGQDLTGQPWTARRELLERLDLGGPRLQVPGVHDDGAALLAATAEQGLEGIVSKRRTAAYAAGRRSADWRKLPHRRTWSVVVGGWRLETGSASRLGALLVGVPDGHGGFAYAGRVGSGLAGVAAGPVLRALDGRQVGSSPFSTVVPRADAEGTRWVRPEVVVEVRALGRTESGTFRQPSYLGLRDLDPADLVAADGAGDG